MASLSIVINCRNEAGIIVQTLQSLLGVTDDIIVYDNGSTDGTQNLVRQLQVQLHEGPWEGFGKTKNKANALAKYDWILSLDADEAIDEQLKASLQAFDPVSEKAVYDLSFKTFIGNKCLYYGEWRGDHHIRIFNRKWVQWDDEPVHEKLQMPADFSVHTLKGYVLHRTVKDIKDYAEKTVKYAMLNAEKYFRQGKKAGWIKLRLSPGFSFFQYYILKLGFLDGFEGYLCAKMTAQYTFLKYARLKELKKQSATSSLQSGKTS
jgi:glycosyltransferase involved in cell wall biosynthesis